LGLYNKKSKTLKEVGKFLENKKLTESSLLELKKKVSGISDYVIGTTLCFCFNKRTVFLDTNIEATMKYILKTKDKKEVINKLREISKCLSPQDMKKFYLACIDFGDYLRKHKNKTSIIY
ncbi:MAG: hypothetical protein DRP14_01060, partial [Candidatus Aenigmatarchaeota archaeon]